MTFFLLTIIDRLYMSESGAKTLLSHLFVSFCAYLLSLLRISRVVLVLRLHVSEASHVEKIRAQATDLSL